MKACSKAVLVGLATRPSPPVAEVFEGMLPVGSNGSGAATRLVLQPDGIYVMSQTPVGTRNGDETATGTGRWHREGSMMRLVPHRSGDIQRFVRLPSGDLRVVDPRHAKVAMAVLRRQADAGSKVGADVSRPATTPSRAD